MSKLADEVNEVMESQHLPLWMRVVMLIFCQCAGLVIGAGVLAFLGIIWNNSKKAADSDEKLVEWESAQKARNGVLVAELAKTQSETLLLRSISENLGYQIELLRQAHVDDPQPITQGEAPEITASDVKSNESRILDKQDKAVYRATHK